MQKFKQKFNLLREHTLISTCVIPPSEASFTGDPERYVKEAYQERRKNAL
jgi:hypothetical protein